MRPMLRLTLFWFSCLVALPKCPLSQPVLKQLSTLLASENDRGWRETKIVLEMCWRHFLCFHHNSLHHLSDCDADYKATISHQIWLRRMVFFLAPFGCVWLLPYGRVLRWHRDRHRASDCRNHLVLADSGPWSSLCLFVHRQTNRNCIYLAVAWKLHGGPNHLPDSETRATFDRIPWIPRCCQLCGDWWCFWCQACLDNHELPVDYHSFWWCWVVIRMVRYHSAWLLHHCSVHGRSCGVHRWLVSGLSMVRWHFGHHWATWLSMDGTKTLQG